MGRGRELTQHLFSACPRLFRRLSMDFLASCDTNNLDDPEKGWLPLKAA
jgi:hypothetical protein